MSEKYKGMFGSDERPDEVAQWLKDQGAETTEELDLSDIRIIFYVHEGRVNWKNKACRHLFDIVHLPPVKEN